jgi:hypothetical protein
VCSHHDINLCNVMYIYMRQEETTTVSFRMKSVTMMWN